MFSDCRKMMIDSSAKGSVSGSDSRIVIGCSHDSNCAARIRYMKTSDSTKASTKFWPRARQFLRPAGEGAAIVGARAQLVELGLNRVLHLGLRRGRQQVGKDGHLALTRRARLMSAGAESGAKLATLSSGTLPSLDEGTVSDADRPVRSIDCSARARRCTSCCSPASL